MFKYLLLFFMGRKFFLQCFGGNRIFFAVSAKLPI